MALRSALPCPALLKYANASFPVEPDELLSDPADSEVLVLAERRHDVSTRSSTTTTPHAR
jgi:hypothetical protein